MDKTLISQYQAMVQQLRRSNIRCEMFLGNIKDFGRQLKYADQRNSPLAIIMGTEEISRGVVQLKDLKLGSILSKEIKTNEEWKERPAQMEVSRDRLVEEVEKILEKYREAQ